MSAEADKFWDEAARQLRKKQGFCPLTSEEAEAAFDEAPAVPLSEERINSMVESATGEQDEWTPESEWQEDSADVAQGEFQMYQHKGEGTPETDQIEEDLEKEMLRDDDAEEDKN